MRSIFLLTVAALGMSAFLAPAQPVADSGTQVYQNLVRSAVWVHSNRGSSLATGTGSLIDADRRLVLTNYHVVGEIENATVVFPVFHGDRPIAEREYYFKKLRDIGFRGRVILRDRARDLAVIQLERLPAGAKALSLADKSVSPGQTVHSIGNPGGSGALWVYTPGKVRQVYLKRWKALIDGREAQFQAEVVETDSPTNSGDSGGPLVNDKGELVAVTQGGAIKANSLSTFIDISEVNKVMTAQEIRRLAISDNKPKGRTASLTSRDDAKFFSAQSLDAANAAAKTIFAKNSRDLFIETFATVPKGKADEVKSMSADDRQKFFSEWAAARVKTEHVNGIYLLVCKEPSSLNVKVSDDPKLQLHVDNAKDLRNALLGKFKEKKFDEGLEAFVKLATELLNK